MGGEEVIELSVEETNELRAKLGLAPLRGVGGGSDHGGGSQQQEQQTSSTKEVLELSVDDTNNLREKLGLAPLRVSDGDEEETGTSARQAVHKPAANLGQSKELQERMEKARLEREVQRGISSKFATGSLADDTKEDASDALSWAAKMRAQKEAPAAAKSTKSKKKGRKTKKSDKYDEEDLKGMNVAHNVSDLDAGSTTIMTLADAPLLKTQDETHSKAVGLNEEEQLLENVELTSQQKQRDGLRKKRQLELGMGRAGGYAGFDDDEFEEMGGVGGPSRMGRGEGGGPTEKKSKAYGFQIGDVVVEEKERGSDLFASYEGKGVSLEPAQADVTASDFLTAEEDTAMLEKSGKKKEKDAKFKKKKKKEKKNRRKKDTEEGQDEAVTSKGFLDELEATAVQTERPSSKRKRRRSDSETDAPVADTDMADAKEEPDVAMGEEDTAKKRARFDATMAKGNARTAEAFKVVTSTPTTNVEDDEPDDAFLNAALAKARRLRRLKGMSNKETNRGAAVAQALQQSREQSSKSEEQSEGGVTFAVDDTREFTRALQARAEQAERQQARKAQAMAKKVVSTTAPTKPEPQVETVDEPMLDKNEEEDIADLAKEIKEDDVDLEGTTANTVSVGRGMSNVLSLLRQTGEITGKNAGKEELRGRSKDERNYENYEALDLSKVVKIGKNATDKDKELASREVKLEYRDSHGRLLTTKEAWRNLCYDFHGHGQGMKNEERKLRQIAREQAEARLASRQVANDSDKPAGSLGALKATQKATGKAFVIHKT